VNAALEAVRQWIFEPTLLNGVAVEVAAPIMVNFILNSLLSKTGQTRRAAC
jgi:protein TonB